MNYLKQILATATDEGLKKLIDTHPFDSESELIVQLIGAAVSDLSPVEFAKITGISESAAILIFSMLISSMMVPEMAWMT